MRRIVRQIAEKGPIFILLDERQGVVGQIVDDVSLSSDDFAVVFEDRIEVVAPVARAEAVILIESAAVRMVGVLRAVVPFAECRRGVAR